MLATTKSTVVLVLLRTALAAQPLATEVPTTVVQTAHPEVTAPPTINEPQYHELVRRDGPFIAVHTMGFGSVWYYESCGVSSYFATDFQYGYCCDSRNRACLTSTGCVGGSTAIGPNGYSAPCHTGETCSTIKLVDSKGSFNTRTFIGCFSQSVPSTWYRAAFRVTTSKGKATTITTARVPTASRMPNAAGVRGQSSLSSLVMAVVVFAWLL